MSFVALLTLILQKIMINFYKFLLTNRVFFMLTIIIFLGFSVSLFASTPMDGDPDFPSDTPLCKAFSSMTVAGQSGLHCQQEKENQIATTPSFSHGQKTNPLKVSNIPGLPLPRSPRSPFSKFSRSKISPLTLFNWEVMGSGRYEKQTESRKARETEITKKRFELPSDGRSLNPEKVISPLYANEFVIDAQSFIPIGGSK